MRNALITQYYDSPQYLKLLRAKVEEMKKMESDEFYRASRLMDVYAVDPVAFIETFCVIKMTEFGGVPKPFFLFPYQRNIITKIQEWEFSNQDIEALIDKPRGMGMTWLICSYFMWRFLFTPNYSCFLLSRSEGEVDDGTSMPDNSMFGKIRWQLSKLPRYMLPEGYMPKKTRGTTTDMNLKLINPALGSSIIGSSTNANAGRSRRYSTIFIDECFSIDRFNEVYRSLQSVARLKLFVSTVKFGKTFEDFKKMCDSNDTHISLTWHDHPFKDQIWYEEQVKKAEFDPEVMKEVEPDYSVASNVQYYPQIKEAKCLPVSYDRGKPLYCGLDFGGRQDYTVIIYAQWDGELKVLDAYFNTNKPTDWYAPFLNPELSYNTDYYNEYQKKFIDTVVKPMRKPVGYFGEQDHLIKRRPDNKSDQDALAPFGVRIHINQYAINHPPRRHAVISMLPRTVFNQNSDGAMRVFDAIANSRYANIAKTTTEQLKPVHDAQIADIRAAFENLCSNIGRIIRNQREDIKTDSDRSFSSAIIKSLKI